MFTEVALHFSREHIVTYTLIEPCCTAYPDGQMTRAEVVAIARSWAECGAAVMVSEQHPLDLPGWQRDLLSTGRDDTSPFRGKPQEWLTYQRAKTCDTPQDGRT